MFKNKVHDLCFLLSIILDEVFGEVFNFICLYQLQDLTSVATPAAELSFPEQTNYPPKQCLCVSNRTGTNTSLLFPCLCMICVEDDSAEPGMAFICSNPSTHQATGRSWKHPPPCIYLCLLAALPFSNLGEMAAKVWCLVHLILMSWCHQAGPILPSSAELSLVVIG